MQIFKASQILNTAIRHIILKQDMKHSTVKLVFSLSRLALNHEYLNGLIFTALKSIVWWNKQLWKLSTPNSTQDASVYIMIMVTVCIIKPWPEVYMCMNSMLLVLPCFRYKNKCKQLLQDKCSMRRDYERLQVNIYFTVWVTLPCTYILYLGYGSCYLATSFSATLLQECNNYVCVCNTYMYMYVCNCTCM